VIHDEPAFDELSIAHLLVRNSHVEEDLVDRLFNSSEKRLCISIGFLLGLVFLFLSRSANNHVG
jgi:hypothetical protein